MNGAAGEQVLSRGATMGWDPTLVWVHVVTESLIAFFLLLLCVGFAVFLRRRLERSFAGVFALFGLLFLALAITFAVDAASMWQPLHWSSTLARLVSALLVGIAAVLFWVMLPRFVLLPSRDDMTRVNAELARRVAENDAINLELAAMRGDLERKVKERTAELETAQAEAALREQYFLRSFRGAPALLFIVDAQVRLVDASDAWLKKLGYTRDEAIGMEAWRFVDEESRQRLAAMDWRAELDRCGGLISELDVSYVRKDGTIIEAEVSLKQGDDPLADQQLFYNQVVDVTERNRARRAMEQQQQTLVRANESLEQFAYIASHDMQEPLRKIVLYADMLREALAHGQAEDVHYAADVVRDAALRARSVVSDLLAYSRASNRRVELTECDLLQAIQDVQFTLSQSISESGAIIRLSGPSVRLLADRLLLDHILQNLVTNAIKYARDGVPPEIDIKVSLLPRRRLSIEVADNGIGFENEHAKKIFEPFTRLHNRSEFPGTGIGLAICRAACERHGWKIQAEGHPGQGAVFTLELPRGGYVLDESADEEGREAASG
ncbi:Phytochrome-like protein cph1 [Hartmannibacter diazotrophicus]|uniref:histidine kinase n=1 Tax=Hartmannibacter diazotrophicus TaxID=1482074 RepID=A0A2C9D8G5_9HYPH|nr:Phytochrome-like protein cph1 [Hartmannibacter diazotrophicus]